MEGSNFWDVFSAFAWPITIAGIFLLYRSHLTRLIDAFTSKFERASDIRLGNIELKGALLDPSPDASDIVIDSNDYSKVKATETERNERDELYKKTRSLMLVHRISPSEKEGQKFDISIFLNRKQSRENTTADFNDVDHVEYYLGHRFGGRPNGSKFVVKTPVNGFAMTTSAYGSPLCVAKIHFKDGHVAETYRYLDFEMAEVFD